MQVWLPDVRARGFAAQARRQSRLVSRHRSEQEILAHIERAADQSGWRG